MSNLEMGYLYEELIRKFAELSNETAGEHFTPREVIRLMVDLLLCDDPELNASAPSSAPPIACTWTRCSTTSATGPRCSGPPRSTVRRTSGSSSRACSPRKSSDTSTSPQDLSHKLLDDQDARDLVLDTYFKFVQGKAKVAWQEHCPIGELLGPDLESQHLEYKSSLRATAEGTVFKPLKSASLKTIAAFANSRDGGTLLIGVRDDGTPCGLEADYETLRKPGKADSDLFQLHLNNLIVASMGVALAANVTLQIHTIDRADLCRVHVRPSGFPVNARVTLDKTGQMIRKGQFYVRTSNATLTLSNDEKARYILSRWPSV